MTDLGRRRKVIPLCAVPLDVKVITSGFSEADMRPSLRHVAYGPEYQSWRSSATLAVLPLSFAGTA